MNGLGRRAGALVVAVALAGVAVGVLAVRRGPASDAAGPVPAPTVRLADVSDQVAGHYRAAAAHPEHYRQVPCFCGCERFLGHRDLYDCFVRPDGAGYDAHASGCGVCIAESVLVRRMLDEGENIDAIRQAVIAAFASVTPTVDASSSATSMGGR